jgi:hypothetical protein
MQDKCRAEVTAVSTCAVSIAGLIDYDTISAHWPSLRASSPAAAEAVKLLKQLKNKVAACARGLVQISRVGGSL